MIHNPYIANFNGWQYSITDQSSELDCTQLSTDQATISYELPSSSNSYLTITDVYSNQNYNQFIRSYGTYFNYNPYCTTQFFTLNRSINPLYQPFNYNQFNTTIISFNNYDYNIGPAVNYLPQSNYSITISVNPNIHIIEYYSDINLNNLIGIYFTANNNTHEVSRTISPSLTNFNWNSAPHINNTNYLLGPNSQYPLSLLSAIKWCQYMGGELIPDNVANQLDPINSNFKNAWYWVYDPTNIESHSIRFMDGIIPAYYSSFQFHVRVVKSF